MKVHQPEYDRAYTQAARKVDNSPEGKKLYEDADTKREAILDKEFKKIYAALLSAAGK